MTINSFPIETIPPTASLIAFIPVGGITSTDVQAAIAELDASIPAPGPGTDPLFLTFGLNVNAFDGAIDTNPSNVVPIRFSNTTDVANNNPEFSNVATSDFRLKAVHGQGTYNPLTQAKITFSAIQASAEFIGSGQKFLYNNIISSYGMGDTGLTGGNNITFAGGPIAGDEGQGWQMVSNLQQPNNKSVTTISSVPTPSVVNTTTTQPIVKNKDPQTVTVASTAGAVVGDWVVVDQELPTNAQNEEAVQIISFTPTSITGIFRCNHNNGATITPALRLVLASTFTLGQDRILINLSQPSYSTGNITSISGGAWNGTGTAWTNNMVGGNVMQIGAISLDADTYTASPYNGSAPLNDGLRAWYQIISATPTQLGVYTTSVAGDAGYHGKGPPPSGSGAAGSYPYRIVPSAKVLRVMTSNGNLTGELILDTSTSTWSIGDTVEQVICPYPDVSPYQWSVNCYSPGGHYRDFFSLRNGGGRKFGSVFRVWDAGPIYDATADGTAWSSFFSVESSFDYIIHGGGARKINNAFFFLPSAASGGDLTDDSGKIIWAGIYYIKPNTPNNSIDINTCQTGAGSGLLQFSGASQLLNPITDMAALIWPGYIRLAHGGQVNRGMVVIDRDTTDYTNANITQGLLRWNSINFPLDFGITTVAVGTGQAADITLTPNGVESFRCISGGTVKFSAAPSFSANGSVATSLGSVGPAGSHTTVQNWLTVQDNTGTVRYIPCF